MGGKGLKYVSAPAAKGNGRAEARAGEDENAGDSSVGPGGCKPGAESGGRCAWELRDVHKIPVTLRCQSRSFSFEAATILSQLASNPTCCQYVFAVLITFCWRWWRKYQNQKRENAQVAFGGQETIAQTKETGKDN